MSPVVGTSVGGIIPLTTPNFCKTMNQNTLYRKPILPAWPREIRPPATFTKNKKQMTLIVGMVCRDAIVLAGDRETSAGDTKFQTTHKLHLVPFLNKHYAIIGEAGAAFPARACLDTLRRLASTTKVTEVETISNSVAQAFWEMASKTHGPGIGDPGNQLFWDQDINRFQFMVGYYFKSKGYLYEFDSSHGMVVTSREAYSLIGIGSDLARYLIKDIQIEKLDSRGAANASAYIMGEVKTAVSGCGGNTEIALVSSGNEPQILSGSDVAKIEGSLKRFADEQRQLRLQSISDISRDEPMAYQPNVGFDLPTED